MASAAIAVPPRPPFSGEACAARTEDRAVGLKPLHRSPVALREEAGAVARCVPEALLFARELPNTFCPPRDAVPTVAPPARALKLEAEDAPVPAVPAAARVRVTPRAWLVPGFLPTARFCAPFGAPLVAVAPLVPTAPAGDGTAFTPTATGPVVEVGGVATGGAGCVVATGVGGAAGVAGVPKVAGVHAHVRLAPTTVASPAKIATEMNRVFLRT
jgi:hypothetical protein